MVKVEIFEHHQHRFMFLDEILWMWNLPQELELQRDLAQQGFGDVLVAGYGFGIATKYVLENPRVKSVTTVEKYAEIIEKMRESGPIYGNIIISDFFDLNEERKYDCVIGDIWPEIDPRFLEDYVRFKSKAEKLLQPNGLLLAWGQDYFEYLLEKKKNF